MTASNRPAKPNRKPKRPEERTPSPILLDPASEERWLAQRLQTLYGSIADEPLPEDMVRLLKTSQQ